MEVNPNYVAEINSLAEKQARRISALQIALLEYGDHHRSCQTRVRGAEHHCDCRWEQTSAALKGPLGGKD